MPCASSPAPGCAWRGAGKPAQQPLEFGALAGTPGQHGVQHQVLQRLGDRQVGHGELLGMAARTRLRNRDAQLLVPVVPPR